MECNGQKALLRILASLDQRVAEGEAFLLKPLTHIEWHHVTDALAVVKEKRIKIESQLKAYHEG